MEPMQNVIQPHADHNGVFINKRDPRYQFINFTPIFRVRTDDRGLIAEGTYSEMNELYDSLQDNYKILEQVRILGDGTRDTTIRRYEWN